MACAPCPALSVPVTDPLEVLQRLPEALFNFGRPIEGNQGATFDEIFFDETIYGPLDPTEPTPQYEIARVIAAERDHFVLEWRRSVSLQLGLGIVGDNDSHQCPHAEGSDLDRVAEQYGVPRPMGFTDCCLWKLVLLLLFKPGTTRGVISEICQLYTGHQPAIYEEPAKLIITWSNSGGVSFLGPRSEDADPGGWFLGADFYFDGDAVISGDDEMYHGYFHDGATEDPGDRQTFFGDGPAGVGLGLTLDQAIGRVKAAGVAVSHANRAIDGIGGCFGETRRGLIDGFVWA